MNKELEVQFVREHIDKARQSRLLLELADERRRKSALDRFAHGTEDILKSQPKTFEVSQLAGMIRDLAQRSQLYVISSAHLDGAVMSADEVTAYLEEVGEPTIVLSQATGAAIIKPETYGRRTFYYLPPKQSH